MIASAALRCGFSGGLVVDFPNSTRAKKYFLVLMAGPSATQLPKAQGEGEGEEVRERSLLRLPALFAHSCLSGGC